MNDAIKLENIKTLLQNNNADYTIFTHDFTLESALSGAEYFGISLSQTTPTLILKIKEEYFAAIICGNTKISFKKLKQMFDAKDVSMADPETVFNLTGAKIGEISLINPNLPTLIDRKILENKDCYGGCGIAKATLKINTQDLIRITNAQIIDFTEIRS